MEKDEPLFSFAYKNDTMFITLHKPLQLVFSYIDSNTKVCLHIF